MATRLNKFLAPVLGIFLLLGLNFQVFAQTAETTENEGVQVIEGVSEMSPALVEDVKQEIADYLDDAAHRFRGGVNSVVVLNEEDMEEEGSESDLGQRVYISGGMHSEPGAVMPDFLKEVVEVCVNVRGQHLGFD